MRTSLAAGAAGMSLAAALWAAHPATAAAVLAAAQSAVSCATTGTTPCVSATNTSSGIGVLGASNTGTGIRGTSNTNNGAKGTSKTSYGVFGDSTSGPAGVAGISAAVGVFGSATGDGTGVRGAVTGQRTGVFGTAGTGIAVGGFSDSGVGVEAVSKDSLALLVTSESDAMHVFSGSTSATGSNAAVNAQGPSAAFDAASPADGFPLILSNSGGSEVFAVDGTGNVRFGGTLTTFARAAGGATVTAFGPQATTPTVEDAGTAQLVGGSAAVRLDPLFAASIDPRAGYRIFLTPRGETNGLFVAAKTASAFSVRESQAGHATVAFDYRILGTPVGEAHQRMAVTRMPALPAPLPITSKLQLPPTPVVPALP